MKNEIVQEIDDAVRDLTGKSPAEENLEKKYNESQDFLKRVYGGGEDNIIDKNYIEGIKQHNEEVKQKKFEHLDADEVIETEEKLEELKGPDEEELDGFIEWADRMRLAEDGIIIKGGKDEKEFLA